MANLHFLQIYSYESEYAVERNGEWVLLKSPMEIKRGELVRVDLFVSVPAARNFLVVNDPVPGGLEPVNNDLATSSIVDAGKGEYKSAGGSWWFQHNNWSYYGVSRWSFYHRELRHHAAIFYSEYLPAGNYRLSYTAQAIASGEFTAAKQLVSSLHNSQTSTYDF
jgi:alpha-2-macroglobulin